MTKKKQKQVNRKRITKTVKQYAEFVNSEDLSTIEELTELIINAKNYMYSRLSGVHSFLLL